MIQPTALFIRTVLIVAGILGGLLSTGEIWAFPYSPSTLTFTAAVGATSPPAQTVIFTKKSFVPKNWTATAASSWLMLTPASGTISTEQDTISVQVNTSGLSAGTYGSSFNIAVSSKNGGIQTATIPVTFVVSTSSTSTTSTSSTTTPSISLNPISLNFSGTASGANPLAQTINLLNPTGGTLSWTLAESAPWLALNITTGTTTTEVDQVSASVGISGLSAGTYSTIISVTASGATNSPQQIPVSLTLSPPTTPTTGSAALSWTANTEPDLAGYKIYIGTQSQLYNPPITLGPVATYTATNLTSSRTYYFCISAFDNAGNESPCSSEVSKPIL